MAKHGLDIIVGVGKPKSAPPSFPFKSAPGAKAPSSGASSTDDGTMAGQGGGKASRDEAGYLPMEQACGACVNYNQKTSECAKVEGLFRCCDACEVFFEPANPNYMSIQGTPAHAEGQELGSGGAPGLMIGMGPGPGSEPQES